MEEGRLVEVYIERPSQQRMFGNIYKGLVENVLPDAGSIYQYREERNAFLYVDDIPQPRWSPRGRKCLFNVFCEPEKISWSRC